MTVPRRFEGQTCAVLASGPSMSPDVAERVRSSLVRVVAINTTFRLARWADFVYAADAAWWKHYAEEVGNLPAVKLCAEECKVADVISLKNTGKGGYDPTPGCIRTGGNSGYQGIHVAAQAGASRILLCGFDMHGGNWHGKHPKPLRAAGEGRYARWLPHFETLVQPLRNLGIEVINCTPGSALKCWPSMRLEEALDARVVSAA